MDMTTLTPGVISPGTDQQRGAKRLRSLWAALPTRALDERELDDAILAALHPDPHQWRGDYAKAGATRYTLVTIGAVTIEVEGGQRLYQRAAEFPSLADVADGGPGSHAFNKQLEAMSRQEEEALKHADRAMQSAHRREHEDLRAFVHEIIGEDTAALRDEIAELREELRALRADLADTRE
jgi:hypothetical protein